MRRIWAWLGLNLGKRAGVVSLVGLILTLVLGYGLTRLEFATGQDSYLNESDQIHIDNEAYQDLFGGQAMITLFTMEEGKTLVDMFTEENVARLRAMEAELREIDGVLEVNGARGVITPLTVMEFTQNLVSHESGDVTQSPAGQALLNARAEEEDPEMAALRLQDSLNTLNRIDAVPEDERVFENPDWAAFLLYDNRGNIRKSLRPFFPDERHAQAITRLAGNASLEEEGSAAEAVVEITSRPELQLTGTVDPRTGLAAGELDADGNEVVTTLTTGAPLLLKELNDYLRGGILTLGAAAVALMALILIVLFDVRWRLLPLGVVLIGVIWGFGLAGFLGIPLSVVTIAGLPVLLGVGIDYAIQMHSRIEEEVIIDRASHPIQEAASRLGPPLLIVMVNAVFAFIALRFSLVPMIRDFGLLLAVGITMICLCSILVPMTVLGAREFRSPTKGRDFSKQALGRFVVGLGHLPARLGAVLVVLSIVVFGGGLLVEDRLTLETDPERWVNQSSHVVTDIDSLRGETGSAGELGIYLQIAPEETDDAQAAEDIVYGPDDLFTDDTVGFLHEFANRELDGRPDDLLTASSVVTTVSFLLELDDPELGLSAPAPTGDDVARAYAVAPDAIQLSTANVEAGALNLIFRTGPGSLEERAVYTNEIRDDVDPPEGITATPSGLAVVGVGLLENLQGNRILLTYLAIGFVLVFLSVILRSPLRGVLALVPVLIAVGLASLGAWAFGIKLSPMTAVSGPLVVAICTEFTTLILMRYLEERRRGLEPRAASDVAAARTGRAFVVSALTGIAGVAVIALSSQPVLRDFGMVVALNVTVALVSALVILPPMLVWADRRGWVSRGMLGRQPDVIRHDPAVEAPGATTS